MRIPPLSIEAPNEIARDILRRHFAILIGLGKIVLVGSIIQIVVLGTMGVIVLYVLNLEGASAGW